MTPAVACPRCGSAARPFGRYAPAAEKRFKCLDCALVFLPDGRRLGNNLSAEKAMALKRLLLAGMSKRAITQTLGIGSATVSRYARLWKADVRCPCGQQAGHQGWCAWRIQFSPQRRGWLATRWNRRGDSELARLSDEARAQAKTRGHVLGPFLWSAAESAAIAYALCTTCGKMARINSDDGGRERLDGNALRDRCFTKAQLAARKAVSQEKRTWRDAKRTLKTLTSHLRASHSRTTASTRRAISSE